MKIYPVVRVTEVDQAVRTAREARRHPVDGLFLIQHDADDALLLDALEAVRDDDPGAFLGVNLVRRTFPAAFAVLAERLGAGGLPDAVWSDRADLDAVPEPAASRPVRHFGGVAFKYQEEVPLADLPRLGALARDRVDVATTSGRATGVAADVRRLEALRRGLGDHPLALASGVTPENIRSYRGLVDHILVATSVTTSCGGIDHARLEDLLRNARST